MRIFAAAIAVFAAFAALPARAIVPVEEVRAGVFAQACCGGIGSSKEQGAAINAEAVFKSPRALSVIGAPRPVAGFTLATDDDATSQIYGGLEWKFDIDRFFVAGGVGLAFHNGESSRYDPIADADRVDHTIFFGCPVLFRLAGDVGYNVTERVSVSLHWNHISNAELCSENEGLDQMGLRVGLKI
ncbi:MAG: acyloxyacyl hydrolase [Parvularculaceae bacterium]